MKRCFNSVSALVFYLVLFTLMLVFLMNPEQKVTINVDMVALPFDRESFERIKNISCSSARVQMNRSPEELLKRMKRDDASSIYRLRHWEFAEQRVVSTYATWIKEAESLFDGYTANEKPTTLQILLVPGVMLTSDTIKRGKVVKGSPAEDLVQWADLAAALWVMGHNVTLTKDIYTVQRGLMYGHYLWSTSEFCPKIDFDLIYMDLISYKVVMKYIPNEYKCKIRILDAYGTHSMYNDHRYVQDNKPLFDSFYGGLSLHLDQFYTYYPHTRDNSFLGFAVERVTEDMTSKKENIAILYGNDVEYFTGHMEYIDEISKHYTIHTTLANSSILSKYVINHGVLSRKRYSRLLSRSKLLVGFGFPFESSGVIEAFSYGVQFLNPKFPAHQTNILQKLGKPTSRKITSQISYLEQNVGRPYSITIDINNIEDINRTLREISNVKLEGFVPREFTHRGFMERLDYYLREQTFCADLREERRDWSTLAIMVGAPGETCETVCENKGQVCDRNYFEYFSSNDLLFQSLKITCLSTDKGHEPIFPAFDENKLCATLDDSRLYSCAGMHKLWSRICPCRTFTKFDKFL